MSTTREVFEIIQSFCSRHFTGQMSFNQLVNYADRYILENPEKEKALEDLLRMQYRNLHEHLEKLEEEGSIQISRNDSEIALIFSPAWYRKTIEEGYITNDQRPELPFPTEDSLRMTLPPEAFTTIDIKSDLIHWIAKEVEIPVILRINLPDGIQSLVTTTELLPSKMVGTAIHKIRHYLRDSKNLSYMRQKLTPIFRSKEIMVKDMLHSIVTSPEQSINSILEPSDFTFQLWTQLSTNLIKEYGQKSDKLAEEHGFCQGAYLIGYYCMHFRGKLQKRKEEESALSYLIQAMRKPPYAFRISEIYEFTDDKGLLLVKRVEKDRVNEYIQVRTEPAAGKDFSEILAFTTHQNEEYFILYSSVGSYISEYLLRAQKEMRDFYKRSWMLALRGEIEFTTMYADEAFRKHIEDRLKRHFPQLHALLQFPIVYFASRIDGLTPQVRNDLGDIMIASMQKLKGYDQIFKLNRKRMIDDAKILLPAWMVIPGVREIVNFFRRLFLGSSASASGMAGGFDHEGQERISKITKKVIATEDSVQKQQSKPQQMAAFKQAAKLLESSFLSDDEVLEPTIQSLLSRWNQTLDTTAYANLTTDVNNLCKDYLRKQRAFNRPTPPASDMIQTWAGKLIEGEHLRGIRNKKDLRRYIELYFVYCLENP